jgi:integrase
VKTTSLKLARRKRDAILAQLADGLDPVAEKHAIRQAATTARAAAHTFKEAAEATFAAREPGWKRGSSSAASWTKYLLKDCKPLHRMPVAAVTVDDIKATVQPFWDRGHMTAGRRVLSIIEMALAYGIAHGWRTAANVAEWKTFKHLSPAKPNGGKKHHAALRWQEMPALYARLGESGSLSALALQLIILTGCRSNEIRSLRWSDEVDFAAKVITIPPERMKRGEEFPVPITDQMLAILKPLHETKGRDQLVFPGPRPGRPIANQALWTMIKRAADEVTTHGCRSSFRSWMADHGVPFEVAEACLAHAPGSASVTAYHRTTMLEQRRPVLEKWNRFVSGEDATGKVVAIGSGRKR